MNRIAIEHGLVLTMDGTGRIMRDGRVVVEGRDIVAVERCTADPVPNCDLVINATCRIVLPGLVDAHTHLCMVFGRTIGPERRLLEWLDLLMPMMAAMDEEALYVDAGTDPGSRTSVSLPVSVCAFKSHNAYTSPSLPRHERI